jgi:hypothetical protein
LPWLSFSEEGCMRKVIQRHADLEWLLLRCHADYLLHKTLEKLFLPGCRECVRKMEPDMTIV